MSSSADDKRKAARETIDILHEISTLLNTELDRQSLSYCVSLIENGVNPEALAKVIRELRTQNGHREVALQVLHSRLADYSHKGRAKL